MLDNLRANPNGDRPVVDASAYIDPTAQVIGNVRIGANVYVGPYAVIRADETDSDGQVHSIEIADDCNVQDGVIIHALGGTAVRIGNRTSLAHGCVVHGPCHLGEDCFVGFRAVVYNATLGDGVFINAAAVVQGADLPANTMIPPAAAITSAKDATDQTTQTQKDFNTKVVKANLSLAKGYHTTKQD